jgi:aspartyl aminopeptidase
MSVELQFANDLIDFIHASPSPFHVVATVKDLLRADGFGELELGGRWELVPGGKYFLTRNDSAIIAFVLGQGALEEEGFRLVGAHTDAPSFRIKPSPEIVAANTYLKLNTETYGGPILNTWLDRPLTLAGRVTLAGDDALHPVTRFVSFEKPLLTIPTSLCT